MSRLNFVSMKICRVCEVKANQWDLRLHENRAFVKKLRACADILVSVIQTDAFFHSASTVD